jgi:hypothetical protein
MEPPIDYSSYSAEQLQDALTHIKRELYPDNFAALTQEIERRKTLPLPVNTTPPIADPMAQSEALLVSEQLSHAFWSETAWSSGLFGTVTGFFVALTVFFLLHLPHVHEGEEGWVLIALLFLCVPLGGFIGFCIGFKRATK